MQVYSLISSISSDFYIFTPWSLYLFIRVPSQLYGEHTVLQLFSAHYTHWHLRPTRYSLSPESSETFEGQVPYPRAQHWNNVPILRGDKHDVSLKILHQAEFKTARQAEILTKLLCSNYCAMSLSKMETRCRRADCVYVSVRLCQMTWDISCDQNGRYKCVIRMTSTLHTHKQTHQGVIYRNVLTWPDSRSPIKQKTTSIIHTEAWSH